jgi:para-aminobenzoate synthetase/4-amino-4-deoxychorismate lyase
MVDPWQPDPSRGVFETLLALDGEPVALKAHLRRLGRSLEAIYSQSLPPQAEGELRRAAERLELGRLRLTATPSEDGLRLDLHAGGVGPEAVFPARPVKLRTHPVAGGLGPHKWADRRGLDHPAPGEAGALVVDGDEVLEAGWANVFAVRHGALFTPPLDGRILPGVTRAAVIEQARTMGIAVTERAIAEGELRQADEVFLTNSIRGIEAVSSFDGTAITRDAGMTERLARALRDHWHPAAADAALASG